MIKLSNLIKDERCPVCNGEIIIELDSDGVRTWFHDVIRKCSCPISIRRDGNEIIIEETEESDEDVMLEGYIEVEFKEKKGE